MSRRARTEPRPEPTPAERRGMLLIVGFALALLIATLLLGAASAEGRSKSERLREVRDRQERLAGEIERHNGEVNALIARVSEMREREQRVGAQLAERQRELERATAELRAGRDRLAEVREELGRASGELQRMLLQMYKSGSPDLGTLLLDSSDFEDFALRSEYFDRTQDYQSAVVERARSLREETEALVAELASDRERIEASRDEIAARRDELAASRSELEAREAELAAARKSRRSTLARLERREQRLVDALSTPEPAPQPAGPSAPSDESEPAPVPGQTAKLGADGKAIPPAGAPAAVVAAIEAANEISDRPYLWGGGHGSFDDSGYDCSGAVSYALHGGGLLSSPLDSTGFMFWGDAGPGRWITVYANSGHAYVVIAGLRFDTSGGAGPRWHPDARSSAGFAARHPSGL